LRIVAGIPASWLLMVSVTAGSLGLLGCDDGDSTKPSDKPSDKVEATTSAPAQSGGTDAPEPPINTKAEPEPRPGPEVEIYGGPRAMDEPTPQPTIYGGPRMMDEQPKPTPEPK